MSRAVLLRCPICGAVRSLEGKRNERSKTELCATAKTHLREHHRAESSAAIRKHQIVDSAAEIIVSAENLSRLPTDEWRESDDAWLPERVSSPVDGSGALPASADGTAPLGPNVED